MSQGPHLTTEGISAAFEELLPERDQRAADAHLATCERCQAVLDDLIGVRRLLHQAGAETPPMPPEVQGRLEAVLAAEAAGRRQAAPGEVPAHAVPLTGDRQGGSRGPAGGSAPSGPGAHGSHRSKHAAPRGKPRSRKRPRSRRSSGRILAAAAGLVVLAAGSLVTYQTIFAGQTKDNVANPPSTSTSSATPRNADDYFIAAPPELTDQTFAEDVDAAVKAGPPASSTPTQKIGPKSQGLVSTDCAERFVKAKSGQEPLAVSIGTYDGKRAFLAITSSKAPDSVDAYVVSGCPGNPTFAHSKTTVAISD